jgi:hypothetical protein
MHKQCLPAMPFELNVIVVDQDQIGLVDAAAP